MAISNGGGTDFLTRFGLSRSRVTILIMIGLLIQGLLSYLNLPKREDPAVTIRQVVVTATNNGMAPERVEQLIAVPIERKARAIAEVDEISTQVRSGVATVNLNIHNAVPEADLDTVFQDIRNKMAELEDKFPSNTRGPTVNTDYGDVVIATIAVTGEGFTLREIETAAEELQTKLYTVDGVGKVSILGAQEERIMLEVDTRKLAAVGVQIPQLLDDLQAQNVILPAGEIDAGGIDLVLEANGDLDSIEAIGNVLTRVEGLGGYVRLKDLVDIRRAYQDPPDSPVWFNGNPAVMVAVEMSDGQDIQKIGRSVLVAVADHEQTQPIGISYGVSTYQEAKVTQAVNNALSNVGQTFVVVLVVMLLFLGWRSAIAIAAIVPFTVSLALLGMGYLGIDLEQISIAAVIISLGLLVDNGLVVVEDIQNRVDSGTPPKEAALAGSGQFFLPLAVASITTVSAFLPMMVLDGTEGEFAFSLGAVVMLMLAGSWFSAMYLLPAIAAWIVKPSKARKTVKPAGDGVKRKRAEDLGLLRRLYQPVVKGAIATAPLVILLGYGLVVASALFLFPQLKQEMFPTSERNQFLVYMDMPKGTAISATRDSALQVEAWLSDVKTNPQVTNTTVYVGSGGPRFYLALNPADSIPSSAFFLVNTDTPEAAEEVATRTRRWLLEQHPEARFKVSLLAMGGSESGIVDVKIRGEDGDTLLNLASQVEDIFSDVPGIERNENNWGNKVVKIVIDVAQDKARELGVTSQSLSEALDAWFDGTQVSTYREGDNRIPITMRARVEDRDSIEDLDSVTLASNGQLVSLDQVATLGSRIEFSRIRRVDQQREIIVSGKSPLMAAGHLLTHIQPRLDTIDLPPGYSMELGGEVENSADVNEKLSAGMPLALMVMLFALMIQFNSFRRTALTLATVPLIAIGAPVLLLLLGRPFSFFALLGLISLAGIIINNAIVMINQIDIERASLSLKDAIVAAASKRIRPILLTTLTTAFGLLPMAIMGGNLFEPMATLMIGGLMLASMFTLTFVPAGYYLLFRNWR